MLWWQLCRLQKTWNSAIHTGHLGNSIEVSPIQKSFANADAHLRRPQTNFKLCVWFCGTLILARLLQRRRSSPVSSPLTALPRISAPHCHQKQEHRERKEEEKKHKKTEGSGRTLSSWLHGTLRLILRSVLILWIVPLVRKVRPVVHRELRRRVLFLEIWEKRLPPTPHPPLIPAISKHSWWSGVEGTIGCCDYVTGEGGRPLLL